MEVGVGLPTMLAGVDPDKATAWARLADQGPFSTISTGELITTGSYDAIVTLAAMAMATTRVRLMTSVLALPLHNAGLLAKQAATISVFSKGRLTLGVGIGGKKPILFGLTGDASAHANFPDFAAAPAPYAGRADHFEEQLDLMRRIWSGAEPLPGVPPVGPAPVPPGGPEILLGGFAERALDRAGRLADGITIFDHGPDIRKVAADFEIARQAWKRHCRPTEPRLVASFYFAAGPAAAAGTEAFLNSHYAHLSAEGRARIGGVIRGVGDREIRTCIREFEGIGASEVILVPMIPDPGQVDRVVDCI
jgi:alkanesulfonate monooxygenase SsuD/methylene tetrahydromethanopterin reductase-like flavin-dependent oxidoreductase (luciferase family)